MNKLVTAATAICILLSGCGGGGGGEESAPTPTPTNQAPTVNAGPDVQGNEGTSLVINGSASDSDGTIVSYQWTQVSGPQINANFANTASPNVLLPLVDSDSVVELRLTVEDNDGAESSDTVQITIINLTNNNVPPTVDAGEDIVVSSGSNVSLNGQASDIDGTIVEFEWTQLSGELVTINDSDSSSASFNAPDVDNDVTLSFQLTVRDDGGLTANDAVNITVEAQQTGGGTALWDYYFQEISWQHAISVDDDDSVYICVSKDGDFSEKFMHKISSEGTLEWISSQRCNSSAALTNQDIVFMYSNAGGPNILGMNKQTGQIQWSFEGATSNLGLAPFTVDGNGNITATDRSGQSNDLVSYDILGNLLWRFEHTNGTPGWVVSTNDGLVITEDDSEIIAIRNGNIQWRTTTFNFSSAKSIVVHPDGVLVGGANGLHFYDLTDGSEKWFFTSGNSSDSYSHTTVIDENGTIYHYGAMIYQINPATGELEGSIELGQSARGSSAVGFSLLTSNVFHYGGICCLGSLVDKTGEHIISEDFVVGFEGNVAFDDYRPELIEYIVTKNDSTYAFLIITDPFATNQGVVLRKWNNRDEAGNAIYSSSGGSLKRTNSSAIAAPQTGNSFDISSNGLLLKADAADVVLSNGSVNPDNYNPAYTFESNEAFSGAFSLSSETVDTYAYIVSAQTGEVLLENDDTGDSTNSNISFNAQPGKYIAVSSAFQDAFGDLKIDLDFEDGAIVEVKELRTDDTINSGSSSIDPSSLAVEQDLFYTLNNISQNPELEVVDPSNPVVGSGESAQFTADDLTYSTVRYSYTSCFAGGDSKIQYQSSSGQTVSRDLASRSDTIYSTGGIMDVGAPDLNSTLIMTWVRLVTEVSEGPPLAPGRDPQCEIDNFEADRVLYDSTLDARHVLSIGGMKNLMEKEHNLNAISPAFLDESNNFYRMYQEESGDNYQLKVPNERLGDFESLLESFRVDPDFEPGSGNELGNCENAWSGPPGEQFSLQCATACTYASIGLEQGRAASCQILRQADPTYPGLCTACN
jgi:hypothetical protein